MRGSECVSEVDLRAFLLGDLPERLSQRVAQHLESCGACEAAVRQFDAATDSLLQSLRRAIFPAAAAAAAVTPDGSKAASVPSHPLATVPGSLPERLAGYTVLGELGRGGMSVVYKARQAHPERLVALKVILAGAHAEPERRHRFLAEADAIARLRHPNIVQIYEVGQHDYLPYLALEHVEGGSLAVQLNGAPLPPRAAAVLVETLARAIHHAHLHGIVHRDLKPANILLQKSSTKDTKGHEGRPETPVPAGLPSCPFVSFVDDFLPKITDFGLAKQDQGDLTHTGAVLGTPSYMAPEQAAGDNRTVGPAADVYALGAILYECLTGRPPFRGATVLDTLDQVRTQEPVPPSRLQPTVSRDLERINLKCLAKEPHRRYASAADLGDDLRRFLEGRPVHARGTPWWERVWKWMRRRPLAAAALTVSALAVLTLIVVWAAFTRALSDQRDRADNEARVAEQQKRAAQEQWRRAEANQEKTLATVDRFLTRIGDKRLVEVPGMSEVRLELLVDALEFFKGFHDAADQPDAALRRDTARALQRTGRIKGYLSRPADAQADFEKALLLQRRLAAEFPTDPAYQQDLARTLHNLATLLAQRGQAERRRAEELYREALALRQRLVDRHAGITDYRVDLARTWSSLGLLYRHTAGRMAEAENAYCRALEVQQPLAHGSDPAGRRMLAGTYVNLGVLYHATGRRDEAARACNLARDVFLDLYRLRPGDQTARADLAMIDNNLGAVYSELRRDKECLTVLEEALRLREGLARDFPTVPNSQAALADSYGNLAYRLELRREFDRALRLREQAAEVLRPVVQAHKQIRVYAFNRANHLVAVGELCWITDQLVKARAAQQEAIGLLEPLHNAQPNDVETAVLLGSGYLGMGKVLAEAGDGQAPAAPWFDRAVAQLTGVLRNKSRHARAEAFLRMALRSRGNHLRATGRFAEALADFDHARNRFGPESVGERAERALVLADRGDYLEAVREADLPEQQAAARKDGEHAYRLVRVYGAVATAASRDSNLQEAERGRQAGAYASRAVELLRTARERGYFNLPFAPRRLRIDRDLDALRGRPDFRQLLNGLASPPTKE
jgi:tetratricopeptide (TPR) repeat protein